MDKLRINDDTSIVITKSIIFLIGKDLKFMERLALENEILDIEVIFLLEDEENNIMHIKYNGEEIDCDTTFIDIYEYTCKTKGKLFLNDCANYISEGNEDYEPTQRIGTGCYNRLLETFNNQIKEHVNTNETKVLRRSKDGSKRWYNIDTDVDTNMLFIKTGLFGAFGFHQFTFKKYISGIFYLLSGGFCGMATFIDLILMMIGRYSYTEITYKLNNKGWANERLFEKFYLKKPDLSKSMMLGLMALNMIISISLVTVVYPFCLEKIGDVVKTVGTNTVQNYEVEEIKMDEINNLENILEGESLWQ